jgi:hypothetical protein
MPLPAPPAWRATGFPTQVSIACFTRSHTQCHHERRGAPNSPPRERDRRLRLRSLRRHQRLERRRGKRASLRLLVGDLDAARVLVEGGIDVNKPGEFGATPLAVAERGGFHALADFLRSKGAVSIEPDFDDPSYRDGRQAPQGGLDASVAIRSLGLRSLLLGERVAPGGASPTAVAAFSVTEALEGPPEGGPHISTFALWTTMPPALRRCTS